MSDEAQQTPAEETPPVDVTASVESDPETTSETTEVQASQTVESETVSETTVEEFQVSGNAVIQKLQELIKQGNIRRIVIKTETGKTLFELPLTIGVAGGLIATIIAPLLIALGFVGLLAARLTLVVEKTT
jgi:hypothetical protein